MGKLGDGSTTAIRRLYYSSVNTVKPTGPRFWQSRRLQGVHIAPCDWGIFLKTATPGSQDGPPILALDSMVIKRTPTDNNDLASLSIIYQRVKVYTRVHNFFKLTII